MATYRPPEPARSERVHGPGDEPTAAAVFSALAAAPIGLAVFDRALRFVHVNAWMAEANRLSEEEHLGRTLRDLFPAHTEVAALVESRIQAVLETRQPSTFSVAATVESTRREWIATYFPITGPRGDVDGACGIVIDVTADREREAAESRARDEAERTARRLGVLQDVTAALSAAGDPSAVAEVVVDRARRHAGAVAAIFRVLRGDALELLAASGDFDLPTRFFSVPVDGDAPVSAAVRRGEPVWLEDRDALRARFPRAAAAFDGEAIAVLPLSSDGRRLGTLSFAFREPQAFDPDDRAFLLALAGQAAQALDRARLLEAERGARAAAERAREETDRARSLLDAIVENAPIGIGFLDQELRFQRVNPQLSAMNGVDVAAHLGSTPSELLPGLPYDRLEAAWRGVVGSGAPVLDFELAGETPPAGRRRTRLESWYPVRPDGEPVGVGVLVRDVTRERDAEEFQRHVLGVVGHDLRNPLSAIATATRLLGRAELPEDARGLVARVAACAARIGEIVRALLDFARIRADAGVPVACRRCNLAEIVRGVVEECRLAYPGSRIECDGDAECTGEWDSDRVAQLLTNLVSNAVHHGPEATPVWMRWRVADDDVVVEVANAGPPIPPDVIPRLFEPFGRGTGGRHRGLGLGLFIAQAIATAHGGRIEVRSAEPDGTVFSVRLPRARAGA